MDAASHTTDGAAGVVESAARPVPLFISYAREDECFLFELVKHLRLLQRHGVVDVWHDQRISAGRLWLPDLTRRLETSEIILLLMSSDFVDSNFCWERERPLALRLHEEERAVVIPVVVRSVDYDESDLGAIQALPHGRKPIDEWKSHDSAWTEVSKAVKQIALTRRSATFQAGTAVTVGQDDAPRGS